MSVSPLPTRMPFAVADPIDDVGPAPASAGGAVRGAVRRTGGAADGFGAAAVVGAVTGAAEPARSPGVYTGGSSSTVYSRIKRPRAQLTSTRKVTNGSGIASVERTKSTSRPSLLLATLNVSEDRNGGLSIP